MDDEMAQLGLPTAFGKKRTSNILPERKPKSQKKHEREAKQQRNSQIPFQPWYMSREQWTQHLAQERQKSSTGAAIPPRSNPWGRGPPTIIQPPQIPPQQTTKPQENQPKGGQQPQREKNKDQYISDKNKKPNEDNDKDNGENGENEDDENFGEEDGTVLRRYEDLKSYVQMENIRELIKEIGPVPKKLLVPKFPTTKELIIDSHKKAVKAITADITGKYLYTGSLDCTIRYWSFEKMNILETVPYISLELNFIYDVASMDVLDDGRLLMFTTGAPEIRFYNNEGLRRGMTRRGDMYLVDLTNTVGHTGSVSHAYFKPHDPQQFASISNDSTLRFWDPRRLKRQISIYKLNNRGAQSNPGKAMVYNPSGGGVYVAASDAFIRYYVPNYNASFNSARILIPAPRGSFIHALAAARDGHHVAARMEDDGAVYIWDVRKTETPLSRFDADSNVDAIAFSPDSKHILVPEIVHPTSKWGGSVQIVNSDTNQVESKVWLPTGVGARSCLWHPEINQIFVGCTDGLTRVLFDESISRQGAMTTIRKGVIIHQETDDAVIGQLVPQLVDPETERVIKGFWFPFANNDVRNARMNAEPKAPLWGEGHHGRIAIHPLQAQLKELGQVDQPDNQDIIESLHARAKEAEVKYFTSVRTHPEDFE